MARRLDGDSWQMVIHPRDVWINELYLALSPIPQPRGVLPAENARFGAIALYLRALTIVPAGCSPTCSPLSL